jgi:hypothetical protein
VQLALSVGFPVSYVFTRGGPLIATRRMAA